ncbi:MAG: YceI family protein [Pseudomonadota bacterium]
MGLNIKALAVGAALTGLASVAQAGGWTLDGDTSQIAFGSIKNNNNGEVHGFDQMSGTVTEDGAVEITIDLASVETWIDIRNERMVEHVFKNVANATISTQLDMTEVNGLGVGETTQLEATATLALVGTEYDVDAELFVARLSEDKVMVTTANMIMLHTEDVGIDEGVSVLKNLAELSGITRVSPVTLRLMFSADETAS